MRGDVHAITLPRERGWRETMSQAAMAFVAMAAFPRLSYRLRWPTRLGPRGLVAYIAVNTLWQFLLRQFVLPHLKRMAEEHERDMEHLRGRLGREPTERELFEHRGIPYYED